LAITFETLAGAMTFVPITDVYAQKICGDRLCISGDVEDERKKMRDSFSASPTEPAKIIDVAESEKQIDPGSLLR
jgi:predicted transcriptional regulator